MAPRPERKMFYVEPFQDKANIRDYKESVIELSEITTILPECNEIYDSIYFLNGAYHLVYGGPKSLLNFPKLINIRSPMKNTVLHIASWHGNDEIVTLVIERDPNLLFTFNKNKDSALHVAARGGHISTVKKLLSSYANFQRREIALAWLNYNEKSLDELEDYDDVSNMEDLLEFVRKQNLQGNNMVHEAMLCGKTTNIGWDKIFEIFEFYKTKDRYGNSLSKCCYEDALDVVNLEKKSVLYLAVVNGKMDAVELILEKCHNNIMPKGLSPVVAAIMKLNLEILRILLEKRPTWIHSSDEHKRVPLHYAASIGYLEGVDLLLGICINCTIQRDKYGYFPIHLASYGGHVEVVNKLLDYCIDPTEMVDTCDGRNILHIAAHNGKHELVQNILQSQIRGHHKMINQKDKEGNTPLHLAARSCHPITVYYLIWNERVDLNIVNQNKETPLDIVIALDEADSSLLRQHLIWTALKSAGAKQSHRISLSKTKTKEKQSNEIEKASKRLKDLKENLTVVSSLIVTASVAACLAVPGEADGKANNLCHAMFQFFIIFITISLFSSISATIILFWGVLGFDEILICSLKIVMQLLVIALISLSLAFMAGLYTVISKLSWLANVFLVMSLIFMVVVILLSVLLFLPSPSTNKFMRYISHHPYLILASLTKYKTKADYRVQSFVVL